LDEKKKKKEEKEEEENKMFVSSMTIIKSRLINWSEVY